MNVNNMLEVSRCGNLPTIPSKTPLHKEAGFARSDGYVQVDRALAKFTPRPMMLLAQSGPASTAARPPGASSYQDVCAELKLINEVPHGPIGAAIRRNRIGRLLKKGASIVLHLVKALKHNDTEIRVRAVDVLERLFRGTGAARTWKGLVCKLVVVPGLIAALKDRKDLVRFAAVSALGAIGEKSKRVKAALSTVSTKDGDADTRKAARKVLEEIKDAGAVPASRP